MEFIYECWEGQLPLVIREPKDDVVFLNIHYGKRHIKLSGLDYYFAYQTEDGFVAGGWTEPHKVGNLIGRIYIFDKNNNRVAAENLIKVPMVKSFHCGILIPDEAAKELGLLG